MASETYTPDNKAQEKKHPGFLQKAESGAKPLQKFFTKFSNDWSLTFAGALAYSLLTAMLPIAIAIVAILGFILGGSNSASILKQVESAIPGLQGQDVLLSAVSQQLSKQAGFLALIAVVLAIFAGSRLFVNIEGFLDIVYRVRPRKFVAQNIIAIVMMLLFIVLIPIMVFAATLPTIVLTFVDNNPSLRHIPFLDAVANNGVTTYITGIITGFFVGFILFEAIYFIVPNQKISWPASWRGAAVAAVALEIYLIAFPFYTNNFMGSYVGQIGFAVILLVFFYYFAVILMLGAEVNAFFFEKVNPLPNDLVTFVSTMAGKLNRDTPENEASSHVNTQPTDLADKAHIAEARRQEEEIQQTNMEHEQQLVTQKQQDEPQKDPSSATRKQHGKAWTALEVTVGSALAMLITLLRFRDKGK